MYRTIQKDWTMRSELSLMIRDALAEVAEETRLEANPTTRTYPALIRAYDRFNTELFGGRLPPCLVTLQRKNGTRGYFAGGRFGTRDGVEITDEIALNPSCFRDRSFEATMSTLVH